VIIESYEDRIVLSGALRNNFWNTVHTAISLALKTSPQGVIIDCSEITDCTLAGADTFRDVMDYINRHDARVIVAAVPREVMDVLKQVPEVRSQLAVAPSVEAARASLMRLHDEDDHPSPKKKRKAEREVKERYLVLLSGSPSDDFTLQMACEHALAHNHGLVLVSPILVPRELPLQSPLPEEESLAETQLSRGQAVGDQFEVPVSLVLERGRDLATLIADALNDHEASQVFVPLACSSEGPDPNTKLVQSVLQKVVKPVLFVRGPVE